MQVKLSVIWPSSSFFDIEQISAEKLKISETRLSKYIEMLNDSGYIKGA
ncbi:MAG: hypothetical protein J5659_04205 [Clostridia bacterium]|nr:hypothetical protein [Clostridia bacterium]